MRVRCTKLGFDPADMAGRCDCRGGARGGREGVCQEKSERAGASGGRAAAWWAWRARSEAVQAAGSPRKGSGSRGGSRRRCGRRQILGCRRRGRPIPAPHLRGGKLHSTGAAWAGAAALLTVPKWATAQRRAPHLIGRACGWATRAFKRCAAGAGTGRSRCGSVAAVSAGQARALGALYSCHLLALWAGRGGVSQGAAPVK